MRTFICVPSAIVVEEPNLLCEFKGGTIFGGRENVIKLKIVDLAIEVTLNHIGNRVSIRLVDCRLVGFMHNSSRHVI
jgi:hypothetical protein